MKKLKFIAPAIVMSLFLYSCSNKKTEEKSEATTEIRSETNKTTEPITRPAKSDEAARKVLGKFDSKIGSVMRTIREMKKSMEDNGTKITPTSEKNITDMINEAKELVSQLQAVSDKLSEEDFGLYERNQDRLRDKETEFETLKQNK